jgi:predicted amidohydrolase
MIIGLASPRVATTLDEGLGKIKRLLAEASAQGAEIVCFPEAYLPGLRGQDFEVGPFDEKQQARALEMVAQRQLCVALPGIGNESHHAVGAVPGVPSLWAGKRAGPVHRGRGSHRVAGRPLRSGPISRITRHRGVIPQRQRYRRR